MRGIVYNETSWIRLGIATEKLKSVETHDIIEDKLGHVQGPMLSHAGQTCFGYRIARTAILHAAL